MNQKQMKEFMKALDAIIEEKKIDKQVVVEAFEQAMAIKITVREMQKI